MGTVLALPHDAVRGTQQLAKTTLFASGRLAMSAQIAYGDLSQMKNRANE
jgi:hypothetical protein